MENNRKNYIAFGCVNENNTIRLTKDHFGESEFFRIFKLSENNKLNSNKLEFVEDRKNKKYNESFHGDPKKAQSIREILKDVLVLVGFTFGLNIKRMKENYLIIVSRNRELNEVINEIEKNNEILDKIRNKNRGIVYLN